MPEILKIDDETSEEIILTRAAQIIARGGVIAYPTETIYGLGVDATNEEAIRKIFEIKGRNFHNPISLIIDREENIHPLVYDVPATARKLITAFWPGALTIVFFSSNKVSSLLTADSGKIAVRVPGHKGARMIAQKLAKPITSTSANRSGAPECTEASEVFLQLGDSIDAIIDMGNTPGTKGSTIIDVTCIPPVILREGTITREMIRKCIDI